jgi:hypothetical protein
MVKEKPIKGSTLLFGLRQAHGGAAGFPFAAGLEELDAFETLKNGTFAADGGAGFETVVLGHRVRWFESRGGRKLGARDVHGNPKKGKVFVRRNPRIIRLFCFTQN